MKLAVNRLLVINQLLKLLGLNGAAGQLSEACRRPASLESPERLGSNERKRKCIEMVEVVDQFSVQYHQQEVDESNCKGLAVERNQCNTHTCPMPTNWGIWSQCTSTCGIGTQYRSRGCTHASGCTDNLQEVRECSAGNCVSNWSEWGPCSATCLGGRRSRSRTCEGTSCRQNLELQEEACAQGHCEYWSDYHPVSLCESQMGCGSGIQTMQRTCNGGMPGAPGCIGEQSLIKPCQTQIPCPEVTPWTEWTICNPADRSRRRSRTCNNLMTPGLNCKEQLEEVGFGCKIGQWADWMQWHPCQNGRRMRYRKCSLNNECDGLNYESGVCSNSGINSTPQNSWGFGSMFGSMW